MNREADMEVEADEICFVFQGSTSAIRCSFDEKLSVYEYINETGDANLDRIVGAAIMSHQLSNTDFVESEQFKSLANMIKKESSNRATAIFYKTFAKDIWELEEMLCFNSQMDSMDKCHCCGERKMARKKRGMFIYCSISCLRHLQACRNPTVKGATHKDKHWSIARPLSWNGHNYIIKLRNSKHEEVEATASQVTLDIDYSVV